MENGFNRPKRVLVSLINLVQQSGLTKPETFPSIGLITAMAWNLLCVKDGGDSGCGLEAEVGS